MESPENESSHPSKDSVADDNGNEIYCFSLFMIGWHKFYDCNKQKLKNFD